MGRQLYKQSVCSCTARHACLNCCYLIKVHPLMYHTCKLPISLYLLQVGTAGKEVWELRVQQTDNKTKQGSSALCSPPAAPPCTPPQDTWATMSPSPTHP